MAENHLEYGYVGGDSLDEHFSEDPVGITVFYICSEWLQLDCDVVSRLNGVCQKTRVGQVTYNSVPVIQ